VRHAVKLLLTFLVFIVTLGLAQDLEIHFIDVGQGEAVLIRAPSGQNVLYDGGDMGTSALEYLKYLGIENLNLVIASHNHADHMGGLPPVIRHYQPQYVIDNDVPATTRIYEDLLSAIEEAGSTLLEPTERRIGMGR
jgi:competence protein ComEC